MQVQCQFSHLHQASQHTAQAVIKSLKSFTCKHTYTCTHTQKQALTTFLFTEVAVQAILTSGPRSQCTVQAFIGSLTRLSKANSRTPKRKTHSLSICVVRCWRTGLGVLPGQNLTDTAWLIPKKAFWSTAAIEVNSIKIPPIISAVLEFVLGIHLVHCARKAAPAALQRGQIRSCILYLSDLQYVCPSHDTKA